MAKSNATTTEARPQYYELKHVMGKPGDGGIWRPGDRATADQLLVGLDPDYIATRIPELVAMGAIVPADGPSPAP